MGTERERLTERQIGLSPPAGATATVSDSRSCHSLGTLFYEPCACCCRQVMPRVTLTCYGHDSAQFKMLACFQATIASSVVACSQTPATGGLAALKADQSASSGTPLHLQTRQQYMDQGVSTPPSQPLLLVKLSCGPSDRHVRQKVGIAQ